MQKKAIALAISSLMSIGVVVSAHADTLTTPVTSNPTGNPVSGNPDTGYVTYSVINPVGGATSSFKYDLVTNTWSTTDSNWSVIDAANGEFVNTNSTAGGANIKFAPPAPLNQTSGAPTTPTSPDSANYNAQAQTSSVLGASTSSGSVVSTQPTTQAYAISPSPAQFKLQYTDGTPDYTGDASINSGQTTAPISLSGSAATLSTNVTVTSDAADFKKGSYVVSGSNGSNTVTGSVTTVGSGGLFVSDISGTATNNADGSITTSTLTTTPRTSVTADGISTKGTLSVDGTTSTHGINNSGQISTDSLTDGTVTLENGELLNKAGHGLKITENGTIVSGGQSGETPTTAVLTLNDGDAVGGTNLTIAGTAQVGPATTVLQVTSAANGSNVDTTLGAAGANGRTTTVQAGSNKVVVNATTGTTVTGSFTANNGATVNNGLIVNDGSTLNGGATVNGTLTANNAAIVKGDFTASSNAYLGGATPTLTVTSSAVTVENGANVNMGGNQVHGVANGTTTYDAVNYGQLMDVRKEARRGIASASALAGLPALEAGKQYNFGVGVGHYKGESALSLGGHARINADTTAKFGVGFTGGDAAVSAGIGWSF